MKWIKDFISFVKRLGPSHFFYLALVSWAFWISLDSYRPWFGIIAIVFTIIMVERISREERYEIVKLSLEFLKVIVSWPFVVLIVFLILRNPIGGFINSIREPVSEVIASWQGQPFEFEAVGISARVVPPERVGTVSEELPEPRATAVAAVVEELPPQDTENLFPGLAEIFVGEEDISRGSGFLVGKNGYVIADIFTVGENREVFVRLSGQDQVLSAQVIVKNSDLLLALLQLPQGDEYPALKLTSDSRCELGERVVKRSLLSGITEGVVTQCNVTTSISTGMPDIGQVTMEGLLATTRLSQPGDSGSPLLNENDEVIGVIVAGSQRESLAVPANQILAEFPISSDG